MNLEDIKKLLREHNQLRLLHCLDLLDRQRCSDLLQELDALDLSEIAARYQNYKADSGHEDKKFQEAELVSPGSGACDQAECARLSALGRQVLSDGRVALFLVAGGQGSRLGFDGPKGCFPVSP